MLKLCSVSTYLRSVNLPFMRYPPFSNLHICNEPEGLIDEGPSPPKKKKVGVMRSYKKRDQN